MLLDHMQDKPVFKNLGRVKQDGESKRRLLRGLAKLLCILQGWRRGGEGGGWGGEVGLFATQLNLDITTPHAD